MYKKKSNTTIISVAVLIIAALYLFFRFKKAKNAVSAVTATVNPAITSGSMSPAETLEILGAATGNIFKGSNKVENVKAVITPNAKKPMGYGMIIPPKKVPLITMFEDPYTSGFDGVIGMQQKGYFPDAGDNGGGLWAGGSNNGDGGTKQAPLNW